MVLLAPLSARHAVAGLWGFSTVLCASGAESAPPSRQGRRWEIWKTRTKPVLLKPVPTKRVCCWPTDIERSGETTGGNSPTHARRDTYTPSAICRCNARSGGRALRTGCGCSTGSERPPVSMNLPSTRRRCPGIREPRVFQLMALVSEGSRLSHPQCGDGCPVPRNSDSDAPKTTVCRSGGIAF